MSKIFNKKDMATARSLDQTGAWSKMFNLIKQTGIVKRILMLCIPLIFLMIVKNTVVVLFPQIVGRIFDGDLSTTTIALAVFLLIFEQVWAAVTQTYQDFMFLFFPKKLNEKIIEKVINLPASFYDKINSRELLTRILSDTKQFSYMFSIPIQTFTGVIGVIVTLFILFSYDPILVVYTLVAIPILIVMNIFAGRLKFKTDAIVTVKRSKSYRFVADRLRNVKIIKIFSTEEKEKVNVDKSLEEYKVTENLNGIATSVITESQGFVVNLLMIGSVFIGYYMLGDGKLASFGVWYVFYSYLKNILAQTLSIFMSFIIIKSLQGQINFSSYLLTLPDEEIEGDDVTESGDIVFKNVSFGYVEDKKVLEDINLVFKKGTHTALIGTSGSGKTTILSILERLYHGYEGDITMGGKNISEYHLKQWRRNFTYVTQSVMIYSGTIRENILYGIIDREVSDEEIFEILEKVNLTKFINKLPNGLETVVSEAGDNFSGGERQRLSLANAFLSKGDFVLLDEATSSLDAYSEKIVLDTIDELAKTKTIITVAHRLSTIKKADNVVVLSHGKIDEQGTFKQISTSNKLFKEWFAEEGEV